MSQSNDHSTIEKRFEFGKNWSRFLTTVDEQRIQAAIQSLQNLLHVENLKQRRFLDAGSGSGLFSLSAIRLGADVTSFDVDPNSVACAHSLKDRFCPELSSWNISEGSLTDRHFLKSLGEFDVVYCWGVAHHTGDMWNCIENLLPLVKPGGAIVLSIYNDQKSISQRWYEIKRIYQRLPRFLRPLYTVAIGSWSVLQRFVATSMATCLRVVRFRNPFVPFWTWGREIYEWATGTESRGMHSWYDLVDWVGGWPFEVATPEAVFRFMRDRGFALVELTTSGGHGCNEFVFTKRDLRSSENS